MACTHDVARRQIFAIFRPFPLNNFCPCSSHLPAFDVIYGRAPFAATPPSERGRGKVALPCNCHSAASASSAILHPLSRRRRCRARSLFPPAADASLDFDGDGDGLLSLSLSLSLSHAAPRWRPSSGAHLLFRHRSALFLPPSLHCQRVFDKVGNFPSEPPNRGLLSILIDKKKMKIRCSFLRH